MMGAGWGKVLPNASFLISFSIGRPEPSFTKSKGFNAVPQFLVVTLRATRRSTVQAINTNSKNLTIILIGIHVDKYEWTGWWVCEQPFLIWQPFRFTFVTGGIYSFLYFNSNFVNASNNISPGGPRLRGRPERYTAGLSALSSLQNAVVPPRQKPPPSSQSDVA